MKITTRETITTTEIECTAEELRQSNSVSDALYGALRRAFNGPISNYSEEQVEETESEEE